jgi:hypothetical protein
MEITSGDLETVVIYVRYAPNTDREIMNTYINSAHYVIETTVKAYGWQDWVKVKEDVAMRKARN